MTQPTDQVRDLLRTTVDQLPGGPVVAPVERLLARARRGRRQRRRFQLAGAFAFVLVAAGVPTAVLTRATGPTPLPRYAVPTVSAYPSTPPLSEYRWSHLPPAPIEGRSASATVWTGTQMVVWGGLSVTGEQAYGDGAAYNPATNSWHKLARAPLSARSDPAYVWTGHQLFVWGGRIPTRTSSDNTADGALYDPATDTWRPIASSPLSARGNAIALWTGHEVVVLGGVPDFSIPAVELDAAAYNPATDTWRTLPGLPRLRDQPEVITAVATPDGIDAWMYWAHDQKIKPGEFEVTFGINLAHYDPRTGKWQLSEQKQPQDLGAPIWTGRELVFPAAVTWMDSVPRPASPAQNLSGWRMDPATGALQRIPHGPVDDLGSASLWAGSVLLSFDGSKGGVASQAATWDPATNRWTPLAPAPLYGSGSGAVWTGKELLEWGLMRATGAPDRGGETITAGLRFGP